ncbi:hypothetical protein [Streptomyces sp. MK37H]|nr:hypothetical protein [Streptomyces sp. MK37H]
MTVTVADGVADGVVGGMSAWAFQVRSPVLAATASNATLHH